ncbi:recombination associated protein RdgC [Nitrosomonas sp. Nm51]|uniref:recombination-associated protein RdgC n=1 Tax=Nitrosomonas sp. Nm51 TaxID=133720 RepID=UPI0008BF817F|nr:recombination-associated protein RdgC [Nitrosomonas sp. Nm51]SER37624.1 recombination associated protein RdgC [Nitrosomonas sp. Nm51]
MWFKNLLIYRISDGKIDPTQVNDALGKLALQDCPQMEMQSVGWVQPKEGADQFVHVCDRHLLFALGIEKKLLPNTVVSQYAKERIATMEQHQGHKAGKRQVRNIREAVLIELMPRAFVHRQAIYAWIDVAEGLLVVDAANLKKAEELVDLLLKTVAGVRLVPITTNISPATAMTRWLSGDDPPAIFTIDRDCELQGVDDEKSIIRYTHHVLNRDDTVRHITAGKRVIRLALTWAGRISFVLHDNFQIKRIEPLDIIKESSDATDSDELFDSDFALMTGELSRFLPDLLHALGGENRSGI